jgi:long-subunit acyl-CoA synthetase (AMP-forming)
VSNLKAARPTKFIAVPRVWEKMQEKMEEAARNSGTLKKALVFTKLNIFWRENIYFLR